LIQYVARKENIIYKRFIDLYDYLNLCNFIYDFFTKIKD